MESMTMAELRTGRWGLFDAIYGPEKVLEVHAHNVGAPMGDDGSMVASAISWPCLRFHVCNERDSDRYVLRFPHEPVLAMPYPDTSVHAKLAATAPQGLAEAEAAA